MLHLKCTIPKEICWQRDDNGYCKVGILCQKIVEKCNGCDRIDNGYCRAYINPSVKWRSGRQCPLASHMSTLIKEEGKHRVGQQKQKKYS